MKHRLIVFGGITFLMFLFVNAFAVSYPPAALHHHGGQGVFVRGDAVYLFHSGTRDMKKTIRVNDILTVYRTSPACEVTEAGKIKVLSYVGDTYIKGEVVEGEIRHEDIAKKGGVSCLVISAGVCDH